MVFEAAYDLGILLRNWIDTLPTLVLSESPAELYGGARKPLSQRTTHQLGPHTKLSPRIHLAELVMREAKDYLQLGEAVAIPCPKFKPFGRHSSRTAIATVVSRSRTPSFYRQNGGLHDHSLRFAERRLYLVPQIPATGDCTASNRKLPGGKGADQEMLPRAERRLHRRRRQDG